MENNSYNIDRLDGKFQHLEEIVEKMTSRIQSRSDSEQPSVYALINEKFSTLDSLREKDFGLLRKEIESINSDISILNERCQEMRGEINQIKIIFDNLKSQLDEKSMSKTNFINNVVWPIVVIISISILGFCFNSFLKINLQSDDYQYKPIIRHIEQSK